jgi:hypothetical protein
MVRGGDSALRGGEASTTALLLASRVLLYFTMRRGAGAAPRGRASPLDVFSPGPLNPTKGAWAPSPPCPERGGRRGAGAAAEHFCTKVRRVRARTRPVRLPSSVRAHTAALSGGGRICISNLVDSTMQGGDARGNVRYTAIGRISDRVLIATYHHYTTGAPASKVLHLVPQFRIHRASNPCPACAYALTIQQRCGIR